MTSGDRRLVIIGAGALARTLGRVFLRSGAYRLAAVVGRTQAGAEDGAQFMIEGTSAAFLNCTTALSEAIEPGMTVLIATPDRVIESVSAALAASARLDRHSVVFHCSGALGSDVLGACKAAGAAIASVHPLASFADPASLARQFQGVFCTAEGELRALEELEAAFGQAGARLIRIKSADKALYHAGAVLASGHVAALLGASLDAFAAAGIDQASARDMLAPLVRITVDNVIQRGALAAMTGPLPRGDDAIVQGHYRALEAGEPALARLYAEMTRYAATMLSRCNPLESP